MSVLETAEAPGNPPDQALYSVNDSCVYLGRISRATLYRLFDNGLRSVRQGRSRYVTKQDLDSYVETLKRMSFDNQ